MFCKLNDLLTESDVEQKLVLPILTTASPLGLAYATEELRTKLSIRRFQIDKGKAQKLYYPDYLVLLEGLPVLIVEVKTPGEDVVEALREARLYANELNALYPAGINPCSRVIAVSGTQLASSLVDSATPDVELAFKQLTETDIDYAAFVDLSSRAALRDAILAAKARLKKGEFARALDILGGRSVRDEELANNTFGATIQSDYRHLFNPTSREDRRFIAKNAYIASTRRSQYVEPIDRIIRASVPPSVSASRPIDDTSAPAKVVTALKRSDRLVHEVMLLVGGVGSGKSTFVDYLQAVALSPDVRESTVWLHLNMNEAPLDPKFIYEWVLLRTIDEFRAAFSDENFEEPDVWKRIFSVELNRFRKIVLDGVPPTSSEYPIRVSMEVHRLIASPRETVDAMMRYFGSERNKSIILVLDNSDKGKLDDQLLMFQVAQWAKSEFRCVVFLPIRDVTYDLHRHRPPLDTALKDLVFYIEPPPFSKVLARRIRLALDAMARDYGPKKLKFLLTSGVEVEYPATDLAMYLVSIAHSLFEYDRIVRRLITALAGRDVRRAMELFLEFCTSGHIAENEIWQIKASQGQHKIDYHVVVRVLLRMNRRFYDGDKSYLKNIVQCDPNDVLPDHFVRVAILKWLQTKFAVPGPTNVRGYHKASSLGAELLNYGHSLERVRTELKYLVRAGCIITEHQDREQFDEGDLISISPSGWVHLELLENVAYLGACAEDLWFEDAERARRIANRIGRRGTYGHYSPTTLTYNSLEVVEYLKEKQAKWLQTPDKVLADQKSPPLHDFSGVDKAIQKAVWELEEADTERGILGPVRVGDEIEGHVVGIQPFGVFVRLVRRIDGLLHISRVPKAPDGNPRSYLIGDRVRVRVGNINDQGKIGLDWIRDL